MKNDEQIVKDEVIDNIIYVFEDYQIAVARLRLLKDITLDLTGIGMWIFFMLNPNHVRQRQKIEKDIIKLNLEMAEIVANSHHQKVIVDYLKNHMDYVIYDNLATYKSHLNYLQLYLEEQRYNESIDLLKGLFTIVSEDYQNVYHVEKPKPVTVVIELKALI